MVLEGPSSGVTSPPPSAATGVRVGARGTALSPLRPAGSVDVGGHLVDVVTEGGYVDAGTAVQITAVEGNQVRVRPLTRPPREEEAL